jgi:DNA-binding transcriptional MocR family regulator
MRLGCVVAPPEILERIVAVVWSSMIMASPIGADLLSGWIEDGTAARIAEWKRHEVAARQLMARRLLDGERLQTHPGSPHIWLHLPSRWSSESFVSQLRGRGVVLNGATQFATGDMTPRAVRVCLGPPRTRGGLEQALTIVRQTLAGYPMSARAV